MRGKQILFAAFVLSMTIPFVSFAFETVNVDTISGNSVTGDFTGSYLVYAGSGVLKKVIINTDGTNDVTLILRDSLTASAGRAVWRGTCLGSSKTCIDNLNAAFTTGLYGNVTTSGTAIYNMEYRAQ